MSAIYRVQTDMQNDASDWWEAARALASSLRNPTFTRVLNRLEETDDEVEIDQSDFESFLSAARQLPGWDDGGRQAPHPLIWSDPGERDFDVIAVGDWVVAGTTSEDLDVGQIRELASFRAAVVAWESGVSAPCDLNAEDVDVYATRDAAVARRDARKAELTPWATDPEQFARGYNWEDTEGVIDAEYAADQIMSELGSDDPGMRAALVASAERENARRADWRRDRAAVGDWVVAGVTAEGAVIGEILELDGDNASVAWSSGIATTIDLTRDDVDVFSRHDAALAVYETRMRGMHL